MPINSNYLKLALLFLVFFLFRQTMDVVLPLFGEFEKLDKPLIYKWVFALILLAYVFFTQSSKQMGFTKPTNWRSLYIYWPMALIAALSVVASSATVSTEVWIKIGFFALAVGIAEELMFRGMVFHWFKDESATKIIVISACSFGAIHLFGLMSDIDPMIILAQAFFASGFGVLFAIGRYRDASIVIPIAVHFLFDFVAIGAKGGVGETFADAAQVVPGLLFAGTVSWLWGVFLLWRLNKSAKQQKEVIA